MSVRHALLVGTLLAAVLEPSFARAAQIGPIQIALHDGGFDMTFDAVIEAPSSRVFAILSDYAHLEQINPQITSATFTRSPTGTGGRLRTVLHSCVWFFCKNLVQVEDVREPDSNTIVARIIPGAGDFSGGSSVWHLQSDGAVTRVHYEATRKPTTWFPSFIGAPVIKRTLRAQFRSSIDALERLARATP